MGYNGGVTPELLTDLDSRQSASRSWFPPHLKTRPVLCDAVAQPKSAEDVAALAAWATANGKSFRAVGGGSGTGELPSVDIAVEMSRLTTLSWSEEDLTVTAGAGVTISTIEEQLAGHGYTLGQSLGSATLATVGGCIATDAHGLFTGRYGSFRQAVLDQTAIGGIIVAATLAMRPQPEARAWAVLDFGDFDAGADRTLPARLCRLPAAWGHTQRSRRRRALAGGPPEEQPLERQRTPRYLRRLCALACSMVNPRRDLPETKKHFRRPRHPVQPGSRPLDPARRGHRARLHPPRR